MRTITIRTSETFRFAPTVFSHGWRELPPFSCEDREQALFRMEKLTTGRAVRLRITQGADLAVRVRVESASEPLKRADIRAIEQVVRSCLNTDRDLKPFYAILKGKPRYRWITKAGAGRLLVSPTVWEDLAKTLLTTNTTWQGTVGMCRRLAALGDPAGSGETCFPTPEQVAGLKIEELAEAVRAGYRTAYLYELATRIADGSLPVESWRNPDIDSEDIYRALQSIKGFGDYAAGNMLKLLGRFDRLGIDTACRAAFRAQVGSRARASDDHIRRYYDQFGPWRGLALWMDVMRVYLPRNLANYRSR